MKKALPTALGYCALALTLACPPASALEPYQIRNLKGCTAEQEDALRNAEADLLARLQHIRSELSRYSLRTVYEQFIVPNRRLWREGSEANANYVRYLEKMDRALGRMEADTRSGLDMACRDDRFERHCQNGEVYAYVLFLFGYPRKTLYFCSSFFKQSPHQQKSTLLHELSHYSASTDDLAGSWSGGGRTDILQAPTDAYHFEQFMSEDVEATLKRSIWYWNWPRDPAQPSPAP